MAERIRRQPCMSRAEEATFHRSMGQHARHFRELLASHAESLGLDPQSDKQLRRVLPTRGQLVLTVRQEVRQELIAA